MRIFAAVGIFFLREACMLATKRGIDLLQPQIGNAAPPLCADDHKLMLRLEPNTSRRSQ